MHPGDISLRRGENHGIMYNCTDVSKEYGYDNP